MLLRGLGEGRLSCCWGWCQPERLVVTGEYPGDVTNTVLLTRHQITVAVGRGPRVIAREITRRLLPAYLESLAAVRDHLAERERARRHRVELAAHLRALAPGGHVRHDRMDTHVSWGDWNRSHSAARSLTIRLSGDGTEAHVEIYGACPAYVRRIARGFTTVTDEALDNAEEAHRDELIIDP